jgi:hypothetical protein
MLIFANGSLGYSQSCCDLFLLESVLFYELPSHKCTESWDNGLRSHFTGNYQKETVTEKDE